MKCLESEGVRYVFGVPGEENLLLLEAIRKSKIQFIVTRHEQAAVFMAATVGRWTGKIGVALSTLGPGATNLVTGIAYATLGGFPVLAITGQKPIRKSKQGKFQIIPVVKMMKPVTKFSRTISNGTEVSAFLSQAITAAQSGRPGAIHLELPEDVAEDRVSATYIKSKKISPVAASPALIRKLVKILEKARHPIIIIGGGANRVPISAELLAFVRGTKIPFITTQTGKGALDESSEFYIGTTALRRGDYVHKAVQYADVVITIGHDVFEGPPAILPVGKSQTLVHVNTFVSRHALIYTPTLEVVGDMARTLLALTGKVKPSKFWDFSYFYRVRTALRKNLQRSAGDGAFPCKPERVVADIREAVPEDGILSLDNGMYKIFIGRGYEARRPNTVLLDNALATMGAGLPVGIATKLLYPKRKVLVVAGDGGFMMNAGELETAKRLGLDLVILILNDGGFGMIRWKQKEMGFPDFSMKFGNPDFVALAKSFDVYAHRVTKISELLPTLKNALNSRGIHVVDCPIDYSGVNDALGGTLAEEVKGL